jgi:transposase InsO family protein
MKRLDEDGPDALVQLPVPVNKFPAFVSHIVHQLKTLCPALGKVKIAETLARAGLHLGVTTIGRMLKERRCLSPPPTESEPVGKQRVVTAKYPNHVWHVDLTVVPTGSGFWTSWFPFALPQRWPFCWWVAVVIDHFSRRVVGVTAFNSQPSSEHVRAFLGRAMAKAKQDSTRPKAHDKPRWKTSPKYIVCDRGGQFDCPGFREWCKRKGIKPPHYGAIGKHGSIAVVERFILTLKTLLARLLFVPYRRDAFLRELTSCVEWYNEHRAHAWLGGRTPNEVYIGRFPANRKPRYEPRTRWPRGSPCAKPWALVRGSPGAKLAIEVSFHNGKRHLPIVKVNRAA